MIKQGKQWLEPFGYASVGWNVVAVIVPRSTCGVVTKIERYERRPRLDQTSREQCLLAP